MPESEVIVGEAVIILIITVYWINILKNFYLEKYTITKKLVVFMVDDHSLTKHFNFQVNYFWSLFTDYAMKSFSDSIFKANWLQSLNIRNLLIALGLLLVANHQSELLLALFLFVLIYIVALYLMPSLHLNSLYKYYHSAELIIFQEKMTQSLISSKDHS